MTPLRILADRALAHLVPYSLIPAVRRRYLIAETRADPDTRICHACSGTGLLDHTPPPPPSTPAGSFAADLAAELRAKHDARPRCTCGDVTIDPADGPTLTAGGIRHRTDGPCHLLPEARRFA